MADHSVVTRDELHESEVSQSSMFCFDNASQKTLASSSIYSVLFRCAYELLFLNATRRDRNLPPFTSKGKYWINAIRRDEENGVHDRRGN